MTNQKMAHPSGLIAYPNEDCRHVDTDYGGICIPSKTFLLRLGFIPSEPTSEEKLTSQEADPAGDWIGKAYQYYANNIETEEMEDGEGFRVSIEKYMPKEERKPIITVSDVRKYFATVKNITNLGDRYNGTMGFLRHMKILEEETLSEGTPKETYEQYTKRHENLYSDIKPEGTAETSHGGTSKKSLLVGSIPTMQKNSLTKETIEEICNLASDSDMRYPNGFSRKKFKEKLEVFVIEDFSGKKVGETGEETTITKEKTASDYRKEGEKEFQKKIAPKRGA